MTINGALLRMKRFLRYPLYKLLFGHYCFNDDVESFKHITKKYVYLGEKVYIGYNARIQGVSRFNNVCFNPKIEFGRGASVQQNGHITCANNIRIGENTAIGAGVTITDIHHPYDDVNLPIEHQDIIVQSVIIGDECKIYNNAVILPGVTIGKHCTIGANSVVNKDIPDYSVAVGCPVRIIKHFDFDLKQWVSSAKINKNEK